MKKDVLRRVSNLSGFYEDILMDILKVVVLSLSLETDGCCYFYIDELNDGD